MDLRFFLNVESTVWVLNTYLNDFFSGAKLDTMLLRRVPYLTTQIRPIIPMIPSVKHFLFRIYRGVVIEKTVMKDA